MRQRPYIVPEDYFLDLQQSLGRIPVQDAEQEEHVSNWAKIKPYLALATVFAVAMIAGALIFRSYPTSDDALYEQMYFSNMILSSDPYQIYDDYDYAEDISESDILDYLIESNVPLVKIDYILTQNQ